MVEAHRLNKQLSIKFGEIYQKTSKSKKVTKKKIRVELNDRVKLLNLTNHLMMDIQIVTSNKENQFEYKISSESPLGKAIYKQEVGEIVKMRVRGKEEVYKIVAIT